jgi:UTRA domain
MALVASVNYREQQRADTVLVTEGTGFLGAHTIARLLAGGHQVRTTIRSLSRQADVEAMLRTAGTPDAGSVRYRPADLTADDGWTEAAPLTVLLTREEDWQAGEHTDAALRPTGEHSDMPVRFLAETTGASAEIAAALHVADGARVVLRRSHLYLDQAPWSLVASYYPMDIASGTPLEQAGQMEQSAGLVLAELGHRPAGYRDDIYARMPDPTEAEFFQLGSVVPLTVVSRIAYDTSRPVRLTMYVYRADQVRLRHELGSIPHGK